MIAVSVISALCAALAICWGAGYIFGWRSDKAPSTPWSFEIADVYSAGLFVALIFMLLHFGAIRFSLIWLGVDGAEDIAMQASLLSLFENWWMIGPVLLVGYAVTWIGYAKGHTRRVAEGLV